MAERPNAVEQFSKLSFGHKVLVTLLLMVGIAVVFYFGFYKGLEERIVHERRARGEIDSQLSTYRLQLQDKRKYQEEILELMKKRERALEKLPAGEEIPSFLQKIHGQAVIVGLDITGFRRGDTIAQDFYSVIPVFMDLKGTFHQILTFFYYVGKLTRIVNLSNLELNIAEVTEEQVLLNAKIQVVTYMYGGGQGESPK